MELCFEASRAHGDGLCYSCQGDFAAPRESCTKRLRGATVGSSKSRISHRTKPKPYLLGFPRGVFRDWCKTRVVLVFYGAKHQYPAYWCVSMKASVTSPEDIWIVFIRCTKRMTASRMWDSIVRWKGPRQEALEEHAERRTLHFHSFRANVQLDRCDGIRRFGDQGCGYNVGRVNSHPDRIAGVTKTQRTRCQKAILHGAAAISHLEVDNVARPLT